MEKGTYEEYVAHLEREPELSALEESDDLPIATMASVSTSSRNLLSTAVDTNEDAQCAYCKATGHFYKNCPKLKKKREKKTKMARNHSAQPNHHVTHLGKRIIRRKDVGKALGAHLRPKGIRKDETANDEQNNEGKSKTSNNNEISSSRRSTSKKSESTN